MTSERHSRTWFVTGAGRGLGRHIAHAALAAGDRVVAAARDPEGLLAAFPGADPGRILPVRLDITDEAAARAAIEAALDRFGGIDVLVNNAGRGLLGAVEEVSAAEAREVFDTNVFGTLAVTRAVLPVMRRAGSGTIVMISSVGGLTQGPGWGIYGATKCAIEGFSESLAAEVRGLGIGVLIVEPGIFRTDFIDDSSLRHATARIGDYDASAGRTRDWVADNNHRQPGDPAKAAAAILTTLDAPDRPLRLLLGADCVGRVETKYRDFLGDIETWREVSINTAFQEIPAGMVPGYW